MTEYVGAADAGVGFARAVRRAKLGAGVASVSANRSGGRDQWVTWYQRRAFGADVAIGILAVVGVVLARPESSVWTWVLCTFLLPLWLVLLGANRAYAPRHVGDGVDEYRAIGRAGLHLFSVSAGWFLIAAEQPNLVLFSSVAIGVPAATMGVRKVLRSAYVRHRVDGKNLQRVVVAGHTSAVNEMVRVIEADPIRTGLKVVAVCTDVPDGNEPRTFSGIPVFGSPHHALQAAEKHDAEVVAIASHPDLVGHSLRRLSWALEARGIDLMVDPGIVEVAGPRLSLRPVAGMSMLHVERPVANGLAYRMKLYAERVIAALALVLLSPFFLVMTVLIRRDSPGKAFFTQRRPGAGGEVFNMVKFRSMVQDAEAKLAEVDGGHEANEVLFKRMDDPRVTRLGKWMRRYSIDELPQLINVVRGEMSLVGPRPPLEAEVDGYSSDAFRRLRLQPGMTGLWQVSGRSDLSWEESLRYDLWYVDNWSIAVDLQIIVRTFRAVLRGSGAY